MSDIRILTEREAYKEYDEWLDDLYGSVNIGGYIYETSHALKEVDPVAYRVGFSDWLDSMSDEIECID